MTMMTMIIPKRKVFYAGNYIKLRSHIQKNTIIIITLFDPQFPENKSRGIRTSSGQLTRFWIVNQQISPEKKIQKEKDKNK